jgi:acyl-CoA thioester hydrolase
MSQPLFQTEPFDPAKRDAYRQWTPERVRFADLDALGHVNNNAFGVYFETARISFADAARLHVDANRDGKQVEATVIVRITIDFLAELDFPADVEIGTRLIRMGKTSFTYAQGLFVGDQCHATAETISVLFDLATRRPKPLSEGQRERLAAFG